MVPSSSPKPDAGAEAGHGSGDAVSYGQLRCAQLAAVAARLDERPSDRALAKALAEVGIDLHHPERVDAEPQTGGSDQPAGRSAALHGIVR